jgi:hypothetical protein
MGLKLLSGKRLTSEVYYSIHQIDLDSYIHHVVFTNFRQRKFASPYWTAGIYNAAADRNQELDLKEAREADSRQDRHPEAAAEIPDKDARELALRRLKEYINTRSIDAREADDLRDGTASPAALHKYMTGARAR